LEWAIEVSRHENTPQSLREMRENIRLRDRLIADFERSLAAVPPTKKRSFTDFAADYAAKTGAAE
jgi:hypothetical protein